MEEYSPQNTINAFQVTEFSSKNAEWICKYNTEHRWTASFASRAYGIGTCPICKVHNYETMFCDLYPELEKYYDTTKNERPFFSYSLASNEEVHWKCDYGHEFIRSMMNIHRSPNGFTCPICTNITVVENINDLQTLYEDLALEYDCEKNNNTPNKVSIIDSNPNTWWKCQYEHSFQASVRYRVNTGQVCPVCTGTIIVPGINDALKRYPKLKYVWDYNKNPLPPEHCSARSIELFWFTCEHEHSYKTSLASMAYHNFKCQICEGIKLQPEVNSLIKTHPDLCKEWSLNNDCTPTDVTKQSARRVLWQCPTCKGEYYHAIRERELNDDSCPYCYRNRPLLEFNTLQDTHSELCKEWSPNNDFEPTDVTKQSWAYALWICPECQNEYSYSIRKRELNDESCPYCYHNKPIPGVNSLVETHEDLCKEWSSNNKRKPSDYTKNSAVSVLWECPTCHGEYSYPINERALNDDSCPYCNYKKPLSGYNTIEITNKELLDEWDYLNNYLICRPNVLLASDNKKVWWKCKTCGYSYQLSIKEKLMYQKRKKKSCPMCKGLRRTKFYFFKSKKKRKYKK